MTRLLLVRHGRTEANGRRLVGRAPGVPLDGVGHEQAAALGHALARAPLRAVLSSPLERAVATARAIAEPHGLSVETRDVLVDLEFGAWTNRSLADLEKTTLFERFNRHRAGTAPPEGEHPSLAQARVVTELCRVRDLYPNDTVVVVSHADPLRSALAFFLGVPLDLALRLEIATGSVSRLDLHADGASVAFLNLNPGAALALE